MPALDPEHNHHVVNNHAHSPPHRAATLPVDAGSFSNASPALPPLPASTYTTPTRKRPSVSSATEQATSLSSVNGGAPSSLENDEADPHDFYRFHQDPFGTGSMAALAQGDIRVEKRGDIGEGADASLKHQGRSGSLPYRNNTPKLPPLTSRANNSRYPSSSATDRSPLSATRSSPTLSSISQKRVTSVREIANRFNEMPDEVPPIPQKSLSRSTSTSSTASKSRASSRSKRMDEMYSKKGFTPAELSLMKPPKSPKSHQRRGRPYDESTISPRSKAPPMSPSASLNHAQPLASQSMFDLGPDLNLFSRKPLFGEVLGAGSADSLTGYGAGPPHQRRGSDASINSPNPLFLEGPNRDSSDREGGSRTAWRKYPAGEMDGSTIDINPSNRPATSHHHSSSDQTAIPYEPASTRPPTSDPSLPSTPTSIDDSRRNSQSRIPVSSRRLSVVSDSGNSTHSSRNDSAMGVHGLKSPTRVPTSRTRAPPPKPLHTPRSPPPNSRSNTPHSPPRRGDPLSNTRHAATSPRLNAYISAPMPKKSPPLRSSRPRQPVSSASTSASRARAVEKFSNQNYSDQPHRREHKLRKPPELEGIDIVARREAIQRSYTRKVGERERRVEQANQRRASMLKNEAAAASRRRDALGDSENIPGQAGLTVEEDKRDHRSIQATKAAGEGARAEGDLIIDTAHLGEKSVLDLSMDDSPTLGTFDRYPTQPRMGGPTSSQSDIEPSSAITAGTSDSLDTFFDDEPQDDSGESSHRISQNRMGLSQLMELDRSRSRSPVINRHNYTDAGSDRDDQESIQIMLGETPILEKAPFGRGQFTPSATESPSLEDPNSRWSLTSHDSSDKSNRERESPHERVYGESPSEIQQPTHLSISTVTSERNQLPWSPAAFSSPKTSRTTMDSDTYSTVNRVLDHYHDPSLVSPDAAQDVQHLIQSPVLARQGGWDPKKVTQLYMQQVMAERHSQSTAQAPDLSTTNQDPLSQSIRQRKSSLAIPPPVSEKEVRDDRDEKIVQRTEHLRNESISSSTNLSPDEVDSRPARASLSRPEDWTMSPSLGELHQQAMDSPSTEEKPVLPPKDSNLRKIASQDRNKMSTLETRPHLPEIKRHDHDLGLVVEQPSRSIPSTFPPPLPQFTPPPPLATGSLQNQSSQVLPTRSSPSPSEYNQNVPSTTYPDRSSVGDSSTPTAIVNDGQHSHAAFGATPRESQDSSNFDGLSGTTEAPSKASTPSPDEKRLRKRYNVIKELVDTEHTYGQDMKVVDDIYKGTSNVIIISADDVKTLFGNSEQIVVFSTNFLDALKQAVKSVYILPKAKRWRSNRVSSITTYSGTTDDQSSINGPELSDDDKDRKTFIGEAFGHHMGAMEKVYAEYLKNHDAATQKLQALQKNPKVQIWLKECKAYASDLTKAWDLDSLLVKPVQRILKYPLLLDQLLEATPENHPDYTALDIASREMKGISRRINDMKKRADLLEQAAIGNRKRKESDVRIGFPKAFGRRTEKLRQQVGLSDMVEDKGYAVVREKFGTHFFQIQVVMRDVEMYTNDIQVFMTRFCDFALAIEGHIDVAQTSYPEIESKWRKFRMSTRELSTTALTDHIAAVRKHVIEPLVTLWNLHSGPQKYMEKRNKRLIDYARYKAVIDRGDKPDKKIVENADIFKAVNDTLKDELPILFEKTGRLVEACLNNFVQLQVQWQKIWRRKLSQALDDASLPKSAKDIVDTFVSDFAFYEGQVLSLSICNGSMVNDTPNLLSNNANSNGDDIISPRNAASLESRRRTISMSSDRSPQIPQPDFGGRNSGSFFTVTDATQLVPTLQADPSRRLRANSTLSGHSPRTPDVPGAYRTYSNSTTPVNATPGRPPTSTGRHNTEPSPTLRPSLDTSSMNRTSDDSAMASNRTSGTAYYSTMPGRSSSPSRPFSGVFSSAMPMSDSPSTQSPVTTPSQHSDYNVIFLAASVYEFNIDRARKEAGYPYLTYAAGEIFDVIGEKGELWLAKNQDDNTSLIGWIWNKHFVKLAS